MTHIARAVRRLAREENHAALHRRIPVLPFDQRPAVRAESDGEQNRRRPHSDEAHHRDVNHGFANELAGLPVDQVAECPPHIALEPNWKKAA